MLTRAFVLIDHHATTSTQDKTQKQQRLDGVVQKQNHCRRARRDSRQSSIPIIGRRLIVLLRILIEKFLAVINRRHAMLVQLLRTADGQTDLRATTDGRKLHSSTMTAVGGQTLLVTTGTSLIHCRCCHLSRALRTVPLSTLGTAAARSASRRDYII
jgi:hypothetical protein